MKPGNVGNLPSALGRWMVIGLDFFFGRNRVGVMGLLIPFSLVRWPGKRRNRAWERYSRDDARKSQVQGVTGAEQSRAIETGKTRKRSE